MNAWEQIRQLIDCHLYTADRNKEFVIDAVGTKALLVVTEDGNPHPIRRTAMEKALKMHSDDSCLTRAQLQKAIPKDRTTSYILAICAKLDEQLSHRDAPAPQEAS